MVNQLKTAVMDNAFKRLNQRMVYSEVQPIELVICGGAALIVTGLIDRSTGDVDIVALAHRESDKLELIETRTLPDDFERAATEVGRELGFDAGWLNFAASPLLNFGLPPGLATRLKRKKYGACLTVHFISRLDQIHFKIYAAMDPKEGPRHLSDLLELEPGVEEVRTALEWLLGRKVGADFKRKLAQVLERIGHERIAREI